MKLLYIFVLGILWNVSYSFGDIACPRNGVPKQAESAFEIALNEFKKYDKFLGRDAFDEFFQHLNEYRNETNLGGGLDLSDHLKDFIKNAMNIYYVSSQSVYQYCGVTVNCFQWYIQQIGNTTKDVIMQQHHIVLQLLEEGLPKLRSEIDKLQAAHVNADYEKYSADSKQQIQDLQTSVKMSRNGVLSSVRDNDVTRQLKSEIDHIIDNLERLEKLNNDLKEHIDEADTLTHKMKTNFEGEFNAMIQVKSQAQMAHDTIYTAIKEDDFSFETIFLIKSSVKKLIDQCGHYRARHE